MICIPNQKKSPQITDSRKNTILNNPTFGFQTNIKHNPTLKKRQIKSC